MNTAESTLTKSTQRLNERSISNFPCSLTRNITSHSMKYLAFHRLLRRMITLTISRYLTHVHFSSKGWENVLFELGSESVNCVSEQRSVGCCVPFKISRLFSFPTKIRSGGRSLSRSVCYCFVMIHLCQIKSWDEKGAPDAHALKPSLEGWLRLAQLQGCKNESK